METLKRVRLLSITVLLFFSSCSDGFLFDFLLGPQPNFIDDSEFTPGLNILGVIRPDSSGSEPMSYVLVEKLIRAVSATPDSFNIIDAQVTVYEISNDEIIDTFLFKFDSTQFFPSIYKPIDFAPKAGTEYAIECVKSGFPVVSARTTVPQPPSIQNDFINITGTDINFVINHQASAEMFDAYFFSGSYTNAVRIMQANEGNTFVRISHSGNLEQDAFVIIYAYDTNLSKFLTAPNIFIKPNTYRPPFSTVSGGYGCFGSLNLYKKSIQ